MKFILVTRNDVTWLHSTVLRGGLSRRELTKTQLAESSGVTATGRRLAHKPQKVL